ncbi:MAG: carboxypeptidase-like regulatory domain-containing protein [Planctomycetota bacterium]|jgi:hypothetical protein
MNIESHFKKLNLFFHMMLPVSCSLVLLGTLYGCGGAAEVPEVYSNLVATSGTVTLNGKPLQGAAITFIPVGHDAVRRAYGKTDATGRYELMTPVRGRSIDESKGAIPGKYQVMINKLRMPDGSDVTDDVTDADAMEKGAIEALPAIYSDPEKTRLTADVSKAGEQGLEINFDLKAK